MSRLSQLSLVETLTASGGTESAGFLNDIIKQLWPNINVAGSKILKESIEPVLASTLPGPLANLRFVKIDLGEVPFKIAAVDVHKTSNEGIKLDMDVLWEGESRIDLDGKGLPQLGIKHIHLAGRLSILLAPLTNIMPLIGAAQIAFINKPNLKLDFTGAASFADWGLVDKTIRKTILNIICSMAVLPNRFLVKLDSTSDWFKTYQHPNGVLRLTIDKATGITAPEKNGIKRFFKKITKNVPDCFCEVDVGAGQTWRTKTIKDSLEPVWNETRDFIISDFEQAIELDVDDEDFGDDDDVGAAVTTVKDVLLAGGTHELDLLHKGERTEARLTIHAKMYHLVPLNGAPSVSEGRKGDEVVGLVTVLIASALGLQGTRDELNPSVRVTWGKTVVQTGIQTYVPGVDIFSPVFDSGFTIPITAAILANPPDFVLSLMNKTKEAGSSKIAFADLLSAPSSRKAESFDVGNGATVRASIELHGLEQSL